jgi:hydrogenase maturation protease
MSRAIILACGNPLRGDDGVALEIVRRLEGRDLDCETEFYCLQQWTPELAETISKSDLAIFVDASEDIPAGVMRLEPLSARNKRSTVTTHSLSAGQLLNLARELYGRTPERAFLLAIGGESFELGGPLSEFVRIAVSRACAEIRALLDARKQPTVQTENAPLGACVSPENSQIGSTTRAFVERNKRLLLVRSD